MQLLSSSDFFKKEESKCHRWSLGCWVATGDIWVSEDRITLVHLIMPSRLTGCLRHGNVQYIVHPRPPNRREPQCSHPNRMVVRTFHQKKTKTCIKQSSQQVRHDYQPNNHALFHFFFKVYEADLTHSVEVASSCSPPTPDCGTMSSFRTECGLSLTLLDAWSSSETKNCGGKLEHESAAFCNTVKNK